MECLKNLVGQVRGFNPLQEESLTVGEWKTTYSVELLASTLLKHPNSQEATKKNWVKNQLSELKKVSFSADSKLSEKEKVLAIQHVAAVARANPGMVDMYINYLNYHSFSYPGELSNMLRTHLSTHVNV